MEHTHLLLGNDYCLFLDNSYSSIDLSDELAKYKTYCVGTVRSNRKGIPRKVKIRKLIKGKQITQFR